MASGGRHVAGLASGDAQESWPCAKPVLNLSFAAMVASTALLGTPGATAAAGERHQTAILHGSAALLP
jgi:hypothetical protein